MRAALSQVSDYRLLGASSYLKCLDFAYNLIINPFDWFSNLLALHLSNRGRRGLGGDGRESSTMSYIP